MKHAKDFAVGLAFLFGACAVFVFLTLNNPEAVSDDVTDRFGWLFFAPVAFLLCLCSRELFWFAGLLLLAGVFVGVCVRGLIPPHQSNIWPIAAAFWTALFLFPIIAGTAAGGLFHWIIRKVWK